MEEFAFDLIRVDANGATHNGDGTRFSDYFSYGETVLDAAGKRSNFPFAHLSALQNYGSPAYPCWN